MSFDFNNQLDITFEASADLSADQYRFVTVDTNGQIALATRGALAIGVLQDKPAAQGRAGCVRTVSGAVTKIVLGGSVTKGQAIVSDANAKAVNASSADNAFMGFALEGGSAGQIIAMLLQPRGLS